MPFVASSDALYVMYVSSDPIPGLHIIDSRLGQ